MKKRIWIAPIFVSAILFMMGCPPPVNMPKSSNATLSSLSVNGFSMDKPFASDTTSYTVFVESTTKTVTINAKTTDSKATLTWNPNPSAIELSSGPNVFTATVTAEDGITKKSYVITIYKANASVEILDSVNGSLINPGGTINVYSASAVLYSIPFTSNPQPIWLSPENVYTVKASPTGRAQSSIENVSGANNLKLTMICQRLDQSTFPAESPTISSISYTTSSSPTDNSTVWTPIESGSIIDFSSVTYIKLVGSGRSEIDITSWAGFGILMGVDQVPSDFSGFAPDPSLCSYNYDATRDIFEGTAIFDIRGATIVSGEHIISFVIYDRANNRTERSLRVTNSKQLGTGADISSFYFQNLFADFRIYGTTREYFAKRQGTEGLDPLPTGPISYRTAISFNFQSNSSSGDAVPILGFKVFRSEDLGFTWKQVGAVNYGYLFAGSHTFYDTDSQLTTGVAYEYKIIVFTDDIHTKESSAIGPVWFLPPFTAALSEPANKSVTINQDNLPYFKFIISDARLWNRAISDYFYFSPVIRKADGPYAYVGYFYYNFKNDLLGYYDVEDGWSYMSAEVTATYLHFDSATGTVSIDPRLFAAKTNYATGTDLQLESGVTYYWDIFGNYSGSSSTNVSPYFSKYGTNCVSRSYADVYQNGQQTLNGWFSFTVQ